MTRAPRLVLPLLFARLLAPAAARAVDAIELDARVGFGFGQSDGQRTLGAGITRRW